MNGERVMDFTEEGIVGFAGLAFFLLCVVPMLPFIAVGWLFGRALDRALAAGTRSAETSETSAPSEGCQSGDAKQRNAQALSTLRGK